MNKRDDDELEWYIRCDECYCYTKDIENHKCDWLMLKLVEFFNLKNAKE